MKHRNTLWIAITMLALSLLLGACAERKSPADSSIKAHPASWMDVASADFHGTLVARDTPETCTSCHGSDLRGEGTAPSCYQCHDGPSGHPVDYYQPPEPFHADTVAVESNDACADCHGEDYRGGWAKDWSADARRTDCYYCHGMGPSGHPSGWLTPSNRYFHANDIAARGLDRCTACHGEDLMGGTSEVSCYNTCHDGPSGHPDDWLDSGSEGFHGTRVRNESGVGCQTCHGEDYAGGSSGISCYNACHDGPGGHPTGWGVPPSPWHGAAVISGGSEQCIDCHLGHLPNWTGYSCADAGCHG